MVSFLELLKNEKHFIGSFIQSGSPEFAEASAYAGFRFAAIDLEHAYYGMETAAGIIRAGEAAGLSMLVRVPSLEPVSIKKALDFGAAGIVAPNIDTPEQAAHMVELCRFTPEGIRGACPGVRANRYGAGGPEYYEEENRAIAVIPLVESPEGVKNFDAIVRTPGISAIFLGPVDLSVCMQKKGDINDPEVRSALIDMVHKANAAGVPVGALGLDPVFVKQLFAEGLDFLSFGIDTILMYHKCRDIMESLK